MGECLLLYHTTGRKVLPVLDSNYPQDVSKTVINGNTVSAEFNVVIAVPGKPAEYSYQWYVDDSAVSGANEASYTMTDIAVGLSQRVWCEVTNKAGTVKSREATLRVERHYMPVLDSNYPADVSILKGNSATFSVSIATEGNPADYSYQWYVDGNAVSGATSSSYTHTTNAVGANSIYCEVTNAVGTVKSRTATLTTEPIYLFNYSKQSYAWQARGWKQSDTINQYAKAPTVTKNSNGSVMLTLSPSKDYTYTSGVYELKNDFDLTNVNKLTLNASANLGELIVISRSNKAWGGYAVARRSISSGTLDVSSLSGSYDICLAVYITKAQSWSATFNTLTAE